MKNLSVHRCWFVFPAVLKADIPEMVQNIDHAATFLQVAGVPVPEDIQGDSYLPLLKGEKPKDWRTSLYYHFYEYPAEHAVKTSLWCSYRPL